MEVKLFNYLMSYAVNGTVSRYWDNYKWSVYLRILKEFR